MFERHLHAVTSACSGSPPPSAEGDATTLFEALAALARELGVDVPPRPTPPGEIAKANRATSPPGPHVRRCAARRATSTKPPRCPLKRFPPQRTARYRLARPLHRARPASIRHPEAEKLHRYDASRSASRRRRPGHLLGRRGRIAPACRDRREGGSDRARASGPRLRLEPPAGRGAPGSSATATSPAYSSPPQARPMPPNHSPPRSRRRLPLAASRSRRSRAWTGPRKQALTPPG